MPSMLMLESSVMFFPQFFGALAHRRSPTLDHPYSGESEMLVPISSTNTKREASRLPETSALHAALTNSSHSIAPRLRFFGRTRACAVAS
jgi:hypothetical protein